MIYNFIYLRIHFRWEIDFLESGSGWRGGFKQRKGIPPLVDFGRKQMSAASVGLVIWCNIIWKFIANSHIQTLATVTIMYILLIFFYFSRFILIGTPVSYSQSQ